MAARGGRRWAGGALIALATLAGCVGAPLALAPAAGGPAADLATGPVPGQAAAEPPQPAASPAPSAGAPTPDPRRPLGPPEAATWRFGAIEETWRVDGERVSLYGLRERFAGKPAGTSTSYYARVGGRVHGIHWDDAAKFDALAPGTTVNLYPADAVVCVEDPSHPVGSRCWRLMRVFVGRRAQPPLMGS